MTFREAREAFEQQTPVMLRRLGGRWLGPYLVVATPSFPEQYWWLLSSGHGTTARNLRPATPHELLTTDEDDG